MPDGLGDRMKMYEGVADTQLTRRTPVMGRLDGKAFHTFTRDLKRPWDERFHRCMWEAAKHLCTVIQGCQVAYIQSDEITLLLTDWTTFDTTPWMGYRLGKMCSIAAAECSVAFLRAYKREFNVDLEDIEALPVFDARFWNLPMEEVTNAFLWRQQDCTRNSITMLANAHFEHRDLERVSTKGRMDKLMLEKGINWNDCPVPQKRGACIVKEVYGKEAKPIEQVSYDEFCEDLLAGNVMEIIGPVQSTLRQRWVVDENIPIFSQDRDYIEKFLLPLPGNRRHSLIRVGPPEKQMCFLDTPVEDALFRYREATGFQGVPPHAVHMLDDAFWCSGEWDVQNG